MFVRVVSAEGIEALVTQESFDVVWKDRGFTLVEDPKPEPKPKRKASK